MPEQPTFNETYDEFEAEVTADATTTLSDFSPGSMLDMFAGVAALAGQGVKRWITRQVSRKFVASAEDSDLDAVVSDYVGDQLPRLAGESDEDYQARYYEFLDALAKGTEVAWRYLLDNGAEEVDGDGSTASEDLVAGIVTLTVEPADGYTYAEAKAALEALFSKWRLLGTPVNIEEAT